MPDGENCRPGGQALDTFPSPVSHVDGLEPAALDFNVLHAGLESDLSP
jgi:hypothetical protein